MEIGDRSLLETGFSLVELSIVLVILGLLTGGILSGQSLIRAAEIRSVSADAQRYIAAMYSFRDRYQALPGDMRNAVKFWGAQAGSTADGVDATCRDLATGATGKETCNGDGNGVVLAVGTSYFEHFRYWQHLANAGLIEGTYSGIRGPNHAAHALFGTNTPQSRISPQAGFAIRYGTAGTGQTWLDQTGNYMTIGEAINGASWDGDLPAVRSEEAWNIDQKMDDGRPAYGRVRGQPMSYRVECTTADDKSAEYKVASTAAKGCSLSFLFF